MSCAEIRHLFWQVVMRVEQRVEAVLRWSWWRRVHQRVARWYHYQRRARAEALLPEPAAVVARSVVARPSQRRRRKKPQPPRAVVTLPAGVCEQEETEVVWKRLEAVLLAAGHLGRPYTYTRRLVLEALVYLMDTNCGWQQLPTRFPPWPTVYGQLRHWQKAGIWDHIWTGLDQPHTPNDLQL